MKERGIEYTRDPANDKTHRKEDPSSEPCRIRIIAILFVGEWDGNWVKLLSGGGAEVL